MLAAVVILFLLTLKFLRETPVHTFFFFFLIYNALFETLTVLLFNASLIFEIYENKRRYRSKK